MTYKVRGADCTVPSKEMARVERGRKLLLSMMIVAMSLVGKWKIGVYRLDME